jgi:prephenate dehydrogenase
MTWPDPGAPDAASSVAAGAEQETASPRRIAVLGTGMVGTSVAQAAAVAGMTVRGWDVSPEVLAQAASLAPLARSDSLEGAVDGAQVVFVCVPLDRIGEVSVRALRATDAAVSDVGSVKESVCREVAAAVAAETVGGAGRFVGGHPMAGSERSGPEAAAATLLDGATWVLTPTPETDPDAVDSVRSCVAALGARPILMDPAAHDRAVALVSHLPQVVSSALMAFAAGEWESEEGVDALALAAGGFRDLTRLAGSSPALWEGILRANAHAVRDELDRFIVALQRIRGALDTGDGSAVGAMLERAREARGGLAAKPQVRSGVVVLHVPIPDRPGALARLTGAMADRAVNIEDLQIVHAADGGRGNAHVTVAADQGEHALAVLREAGFAPVRLA